MLRPFDERIWQAVRIRCRRALTLVELTVALGILAVVVGCLIQTLGYASVGQERLANRRRALSTAQNVAEDVLQCQGDWRALCSQYDASSDIEVAVQDGVGDPGSGWSKITVRVPVPSLTGGTTEQVTLVFGRVNS